MSIVPLGQQNIQANENVFLKRVEKDSSGSMSRLSVLVNTESR